MGNREWGMEGSKRRPPCRVREGLLRNTGRAAADSPFPVPRSLFPLFRAEHGSAPHQLASDFGFASAAGFGSAAGLESAGFAASPARLRLPSFLKSVSYPPPPARRTLGVVIGPLTAGPRRDAKAPHPG